MHVTNGNNSVSSLGYSSYIVCFIRHLVFPLLNRLSYSLASEMKGTGERNISSWSRVSIFDSAASDLFSFLLGETCHIGSQFKKVNARTIRDSFYEYQKLSTFFRLFKMIQGLNFLTLTWHSESCFEITHFPVIRLHLYSLIFQCVFLLLESTSLPHSALSWWHGLTNRILANVLWGFKITLYHFHFFQFRLI
jgi:hypothetical protein